LAVLLMVGYGLGLLFSLKTHRKIFAGAERAEPGIALGSASQIALFVGPVLVLLSYVLGPMPMDLQFWPGAVVIVFVAALVAAFITSGGRSAWFVGVLLLFVYAVFAITLYLWPPPVE
jgi:Ca2+:H+ antiporter